MALPIVTVRSDGDSRSDGAATTMPRGHDEASAPLLATTRRDPSATASTSAEMRWAILSASRWTVASSSPPVRSVAAERSVNQVSSAAFSVGFSASVDTEDRYGLLH